MAKFRSSGQRFSICNKIDLKSFTSRTTTCTERARNPAISLCLDAASGVLSEAHTLEPKKAALERQPARHRQL